MTTVCPASLNGPTRRRDDRATETRALPDGAAVGALGAAGDAQDDDDVGSVVDRVDHPQIANPESPELAAGELDDAGGPRVDGQCQDRSSQTSGISRRKSAELALRGGREIDPTAALRHSLEPYVAFISAAIALKKDSADSPPSRRYSSSAATAEARSSSASAFSSQASSASSTTSRTLRSERAASTFT